MDPQQWRTVEFGDFRLVPHTRTLYRHGAPVRLTGRAFDLLVALVEQAGAVVAKDELIARVWPRTVVEEGNLRVHVGALRRALGGERTYVENVVGRGYSFVAPVRRMATDAAAPPPLAAAAPLLRLIGRDAVLDQLAHAVQSERLLTIAGPGGMGKTSVALALAARGAGAFGGRVVRADLAPLQDPAQLLATVAQAAGLPGAASHDALCAALGRRRMLLVLDGCEHLIDGVAALAARLRRTTDAPHIVVTSREPLRIDGERVVRLPPLPVPMDDAPAPAALSGYAAVQLFVERASADGGFTLDDGNAAAVAAICRRLDGIPLALELAAGRAAFFGVHELARRLSDCFAVLTRGRRTALPRHQTLRATLDWSHDLLTPAEQAVLRRLATLRGAFTLDDAVHAAQGSGIAADDVPGHVAQLVAKSMVAAEPDGGAPYRLLDTTRSYALEKLHAAGEG
ncbi:putative ATPase [Pseudoduganella flava]|uniref:Putative ATPase n=1 Tax=Pseudoduganella flava TaxID=871742 RepID=A0A562PZ81_9BURK|nr:winged helix-turn-helix domain-containing protein [Pseudoduganella flava]QGZ38680.1 hypothetical protein GO485_06170 [Pseudoduganella flava]TWI49745.1 putative ATPase [Pseudoduganella flava]